MELIDKSALVAEITKIYDRNRSNGYIDVCDEIDDILSFIDTLEVKNDVPLEGILIHGNNDAYRLGYKKAVEKACELLNENMEDITYFDNGYEVQDIVVRDYNIKKEFIEAVKKAMEE